MFVMFRRQPTEETIFSHPIEAMMGMFIMSLGEFGDIYEQFDSTAHPVLGKVGRGLGSDSQSTLSGHSQFSTFS
jgi:hypothetical protein